MQKRTEVILKIMNVLAWIAYIGLMVKAGSILFSYCYTIFKPEAARNFYEGQNLYNFRVSHFWQYTLTVALRTIMPIIESYTAFLIIKVLSQIKLANPFTMEVARLLEKISFFILATWAVAVMYNSFATWLIKEYPGLPLTMASGDSIFLAGVVFLFAQIFRKGVEIQSENELTV